MKYPFRTLFVGLSLALGLFLTACDSAAPDGQGRVRVLLTDAPIDLVSEARVTIQRVELRGDDQVVVLSEKPQSFDLLKLRNGLTTELADVTVPAGVYDEIRLIVGEEATLHFADGSTTRLKIPSGSQSGIKIRIEDVVVEEGAGLVEILVDFDASRSFIKAGNSGKYLFKPVIKVKRIKDGEKERDYDEDEDEELKGTITEVGDAYFVAGGKRFALDAFTDLSDLGGLSGLKVGILVEVEYRVLEDGTLLALEVERDDD